MSTTLPMLAGTVSTVIFAGSALPMLTKAARTRELSSYSLGNLALANVGNVVHSVYVFHLPPGPIWVLHGFYLVSSALMLGWFLRFGVLPARDSVDVPDGGDVAPVAAAEEPVDEHEHGAWHAAADARELGVARAVGHPREEPPGRRH